MSRLVVLLALLVLVLAPAAARAEEPAAIGQSPPTKEMDEVFDALADLLPLSFDDEAFSDPERREQVRAKIDALTSAARDLETHAQGRDPGFRFRSRSLASDVAEIRRRYDYGRYAEAQFYVGQLTEHCVGCHSRLPSAQDFDLAERLLARPAVAEMEPRDRARLDVATRQFGRALDFWEKRFADPAVSPSDLDLDGELVDYLVVAVRVKSDLPRARRTLETFAKRPDVPRYLSFLARTWAAALSELEGRKVEPSVAEARKLMEQARDVADFPADRSGLIYDLVASSLLYRRVDMKGVSDAELAEAFYLLGAIEARTSQTSWVSPAEFHLEAAIRMAPKADFAPKAYALLEEYTVLGYGGSSGVHLPPEVQDKLAELRALIDAKG